MSNREQRARARDRRREVRSNQLLRVEEQERDAFAHRSARQDPFRRQDEQQRDASAHRSARQDPVRRQAEQQRDASAHRSARQDPVRRQEEQERNSYRRLSLRHHNIQVESWNNIVEAFGIKCREGPTRVCICCGGLWFLKSLKMLRRCDCEDMSDHLLNSTFVLNGAEGHFCSTCYFPAVPPDVSSLTRLEARLVSPYHVFQAIWAVHGPQGQMKTKGRIVNVPVSVCNIVQSLPRLPSDDSVLHLRLARQMHVERNYTAGNIRPEKVLAAAKTLCNSPLFIERQITVSQTWISDDHAIPRPEQDFPAIDQTVNNEADEDSTANETMLADSWGVRLAPAEGNRPVSVLLDEDSTFLAFPQLFGGHKLNPIAAGKKLSRADMFKSFARNKDRRAAEAMDFLLFMAKTLEIARITSNRNVQLRKRRVNGELITPTAGELLNNRYIDGLIQDDNAYQVLFGVRNSGTHWKNEGNKVRAMIRTFGIATLFVTISAAELKWNELLVLLKKILDGVDITETEAEVLQSAEKASLIQRDPITCARYFEHRYAALKATYMSENGPFGSHRILHFYERIEFQHRGSPHVHAMFWLSDSPIFRPEDESSHDAVTDFIDRLITCTTEYPVDDSIHSLLSFQIHRHTHTCVRKSFKGNQCRFGIPFFPMNRTQILQPLDDPTDRKDLHKKHKTIRELLENDDLSGCISFDDFLARVSCDLDTYLRVIQSKLKKPKVFLKRRPCEIYVNCYNEKILRLQRSNMDIQFILDPYACCSYIIDYMNKSNRGLSKLLRNVVDEVRRGNGALRDSLQAIGAAHNLNSELSAQEAAYNVLQMPMSHSSEKCVFIQTCPSSYRTRMLKSQLQLSQLDPDDSNIFFASPTEHYSQRPNALESLTLAQFSAWFEFCKTMKWSRSNVDDYVDTPESDETSDEVHKLLDGSGYVRKRKFAKVIRFVRYNRDKDPANFFRELLMLYKPWRNESEECGEDLDCQLIVENNIDVIIKNRREFNYFEDSILDLAMEEALARPSTEDEEPDQNQPSVEDFAEYRLEDPCGANSVDFGTYEKRPFAEIFSHPSLNSHDEYLALLASLNDEQRDVVFHVFAHAKQNNTTPYNIYLKGGAGVGKSHVIKALYQGLVRIYNADINHNPEKIKVLLTAPTGKAAFNIGGSTLHTAFQLPFNQREAGSLSADVSNTMATTYSELKVVICDEISMVGEHVLEQVDKRLRDLFNPTLPFGGVCFVAVGDFYQIPPVLAVPLTHGTMSNSISSLFHRPLWHHFEVHEITTIMRQSEDTAFAVALNNMAKGLMTEEDKALMRTRCFQTLPEEVAQLRPIHFFQRNAAVNAYNSTVLQQMPGELICNKAIDRVSGDIGEASNLRILQRIQTKPVSETMGLPCELQLKIGARYMMTSNVDCGDGLVNGATGTLKRIDFGVRENDPDDRIPLRLWIEFEDSRSGQKLRVRYKTMQEGLGIETLWTPIEPITLELNQKNSNLKLTRKQFPLVPAEAVTIHKAQGITSETAVLHIDRPISRALVYVGCSRSTKATGLYIVGNFVPPKPLKPSSPLALEMERHETVKLKPLFQHLRQRQDSSIQIVYHNVQSLAKHSGMYGNDSVFKMSDLLLFAETWTLKTDEFVIGDHVNVCSVDCERDRRPLGARIYIRPGIFHHILKMGSKFFEDEVGSLSCAGVNLGGTNIITAYRSPRFDWHHIPSTLKCLMDELGGTRTIVAADLNINLKQSNCREVKSLLELGLVLQSPNQATTRFGTRIDAILSSFQLDSVGNYVSVTSIHDPLWARFNI